MANKRKATRSRAPKKDIAPADTPYKYEWKFLGPVGSTVVTASDEPRPSGELDLIRDTIIKHRMHAQTIRNRLGELSMRLFGESPPHGQVADCDVPSSMLARIRDEANELGDVLAGAADILDKLETL